MKPFGELERQVLLDRAGSLAHRAFPDDATPAEDAEARRRFVAALAELEPRTGYARFLVAALVGLVAVTAGVLFWPAPNLGYKIDASSNGEGSYVQALLGTRPAVAHFTDGTDVSIAPGGRARIVAVDRNGARLALEQGHATLHVVHRPHARWSVDAGPFSIAVTGTVFDVDWSGGDGVLVVELRTGSVVVAGPLSPEGIGLHSGQRLVASLRDNRLRIEPLDAPSSTASNSPPAQPAASVPAAEDAPAGTQGDVAPAAEPALGPAEPPPPSWSKRVAAGDFSSVLAEAKSKGMEATIQHAPLRDLVALADAARYTGKLNVARDALDAQRSRFAGTTDAKTAAFYLARMAEDRGALGDALRLYDRYLAEAPQGAFASEASGRKMLVTRKTAGDSAARSLALAYLARFPGGAYARAARELTAEP